MIKPNLQTMGPYESESINEKNEILEILENASALMHNAPVSPRHWAKLTCIQNK